MSANFRQLRTRKPKSGSADRTRRQRPRIIPSRLRERDSKWLVRNPLLHQVNPRPDFVLRYEACGEKCILQPLSRATEAASPNSLRRNAWQIRRILAGSEGSRYGLLKSGGGESGIRTHGTVSRTHAFQACALSHSAISPKRPLMKARADFCK